MNRSVFKQIAWLSGAIGIGYILFKIGQFVGWVEAESGDSPLSNTAPPERLRDFSRNLLYVSDSVEELYPGLLETVAPYDKYTAIALVYNLVKSDDIPEYTATTSSTETIYKVTGSLTISSMDENEDNQFKLSLEMQNGETVNAFGSIENVDSTLAALVEETNEQTIPGVVGFFKPTEVKETSTHGHFYALVTK